jgi:hypothetical protein
VTEVSAQERQKLKVQATQMAITDANLSQYMAATAAVVAVISAPHGVVLAFGSAMLGVCGNYRQAVANDPPRDDFDQVWVTGASLDDSLVPEDERMASIHRFAANLIMLTDAIYSLLRSLERHDGAVNAEEMDAATAQADAARQNAERAAELQDILSSLAPNMNEVISSLRADGPGFNSLTIEAVVQLYRDAWGEPPEALGAALQEVANSITGAAEDLLEPFDPVQAHPILSASELPADLGVPFDETYLAQMADSSSTLRSLVQE